MIELKPGLPLLPESMKRLPIDRRGYPVPWFVAQPIGQGEWDFRLADPKKIIQAVRHGLCWVCGGKLPRSFAFVIGPMCGVNRVSSEPPSHIECARFSAIACPFLVNPRAVRNRHEMSELHRPPAGEMIERNPGVTLLWFATDYKLFEANGGTGRLFQVGSPTKIEMYCEARPATWEEIRVSIKTGLPALESACDREVTPERRVEAHKQLIAQTEAFLRLIKKHLFPNDPAELVL